MPRTQPALRLPKSGAVSHALRPTETTATAIRSWRQGWGRGSPLPRGRAWTMSGLVRALEPCGTQSAPCPQGPQLTRRPKARGPGGPQGEGQPQSASHRTLCYAQTTVRLTAGGAGRLTAPLRVTHCHSHPPHPYYNINHYPCLFH